MARDMHDILGHSLTVITVKAELAGRLLERRRRRGPAAEIADVEALAREALADVRATVAGYPRRHAARGARRRPVRARGGRHPGRPADATDEVPAPPARAVRLGHARGRHQRRPALRSAAVRRAAVGPTAVEVADDGAAGRGGRAPGGHGLAGLRERAASPPGAGWQTGRPRREGGFPAAGGAGEAAA